MVMEELVSRIVESANISEADVLKKIKEKEEELSGLVSPEGAAYIVAKELGIDLLEKRQTRLKLENVIPGMRNVNVIGKVISISPVREFEKDGNKGQVANLVIADDSGSIRLSLWGEETKMIGKVFDVGNVIEVVGGYVKEDNLGNPELRLGKFGKLNQSEEKITEVVEKTFSNIRRKNIIDLKEGDFSEIKAMIITIFESNFFYEVCPECGTSIKNGVCIEHGKVRGKPALVVSGVIDDGTENIRFVAYKETAEKMLGVKTEKLSEEKEPFEFINKIVGKEFVFSGKVKRNAFFDALEFSVNNIEKVDVKKEINNFIKGG